MNRNVIRVVAVIVCAISSVVGSGARGEDSSGQSEAAGSPVHEAASATEYRQREGNRMVGQEGRFQMTGDRLTFHMSQSEQKFLGLENLAMERVAKVVSDRHDHPEQLLWEVSGVFTEYRGNNYLLITHAVLKSESRPRRTSSAQR